MQGYTHGPLSYTGRNPFRDAGPITEATLIAFLDDWFCHYNRTRIHSSLEHGTPLRQWAASDHPVRWADPVDLRPFQFPVERAHKVHKHGIWWDGGHWTWPGISHLIGRTVTFRHPLRPNIDRIEVFLDDTWRMTAWRSETLTDDQRHAILQERQRIYGEAVDLVEDAAARRNDATAETAAAGGLISPAAAPAGDTYAANADDLWAILDNTPDPSGDDGDSAEVAANDGDSSDDVVTGATPRPRRRSRRRQTPSRRRPEQNDTTPGDDLWALFDDDGPDGSDSDTSGMDSTDDEGPDQ